MSYGIQFLLICVLVILGCGKVTLQGRVSRKLIQNSSDSVLFNAQLFVVISLVMLLLFPHGKINGVGIGLTLLAGGCTFLFQTCYALGLKCGPVSLTVLIVNFSVLLMTVFCVIAYNEKIYLTQLLGILFLVVSMFLSVKKDPEAKSVNGKWLMLVLTAMLATSVASILMKVFVKTIGSELENSENTFVVLMYAFAALIGFVYYFFTTGVCKKEKNTYGFFNRFALLYAVMIGVILGIYQKVYMVGMEQIDGAFMFPTYSGMQSLGMSLIGIVFFRDRLSRRQMFGILCGIACVVFMNIRVVELF